MTATATTLGFDAAPGDVDAALDAVQRLGWDTTALLQVLDAAVSQLGGEPLAGALEDSVLTASVQRLGRLERRVAAERLRRLAEVDRRQAWRAEGSRSTEDLLAEQLNLTRGQARADADTARKLDDLPQTQQKFAQGDLDTDKARMAAQALDKVPDDLDEEQRADVVDELDDLIASHGPDRDRNRLRDELDRWHDAIDERYLIDRATRAWNNRSLHLRKDDEDGSVSGRFRLDPVGGAALQAAIDALARPHGADDKRSREQRQADALTDLAERALNTGDLPHVAAQRPHVICITNHAALAGERDADPSSLDGYGLIPSATARLLACDGAVTEIVVDAKGNPLQVKETGAPTRKQRLAVIARDQRCIGCGAPASRCHIHHVIWESNGGATVVDNLVLVCHSCHRNIHLCGWEVVKKNGTFTLAPPPDHRRRTP